MPVIEGVASGIYSGARSVLCKAEYPFGFPGISSESMQQSAEVAVTKSYTLHVLLNKLFSPPGSGGGEIQIKALAYGVSGEDLSVVQKVISLLHSHVEERERQQLSGLIRAPPPS